MTRQRPTTEAATEAVEATPTEAATEAVEATPTEATDQSATEAATEATPTEATDPERFGEAFAGAVMLATERDADGALVMDPAAQHLLGAALATLPNRRRADGTTARASALATGQSATMVRALTDPATALDRLTLASALASALASVASDGAVEATDHATLLDARIAALASVARDALSVALDALAPSVDRSDPDAVADALAAGVGGGIGAPDRRALVALASMATDPDPEADAASWSLGWKRARPDASALPGRSGGGGGGGASAGRSLDALPTGATFVDTYRGVRHEATVERVTDADGTERAVLRLATDQSVHATPTGAAKRVRSLGGATDPSVNGWLGAWRVADATGAPTKRTIGAAHDDASGQSASE